MHVWFHVSKRGSESRECARLAGGRVAQTKIELSSRPHIKTKLHYFSPQRDFTCIVPHVFMIGNVSTMASFATAKKPTSTPKQTFAVKRASSVTRAAPDHQSSIISILESVAHGRADLQDAARSLEELTSGLHALRSPTAPMKVFDAHGMPAAQIASQLEANALEQHCAAARSVPSETYAAIRTMLPGVQYHAGAHMLLYTDPSGVATTPAGLPGHVAIVCGNAMDMQMAYETKVALGLMGAYGTLVQNVSAVNLPSLVARKEQLDCSDAIVVCCAEQPALAGLVVGLVDVPVIALPGVDRPHPTTAVSAQGLSAVAAGDGVSAAAAAVRTLKVAAQYIQHRKDREAPKPVVHEPLIQPPKHMDREPVGLAKGATAAGAVHPMMSHMRVGMNSTDSS
eukprot:jgi/Ulvmu1/5566/UM023_0103.1